jgi:hypothetical protein
VTYRTVWRILPGISGHSLRVRSVLDRYAAPTTGILYRLPVPVAVLGARTAPDKHCQPVKGEPPQYQGAFDWFGTFVPRKTRDCSKVGTLIIWRRISWGRILGPK